MPRLSLCFAAAAVVAALFWFVAVTAKEAWFGGLLAFVVLGLTLLAMVFGPGSARPGDEMMR